MTSFLAASIKWRWLIAVFLLAGSTAQADLNNYGVVADAMQNSSYTRFRSPDGLYFLQDNGGHTGFNYWWMAHGIDSFIDAYQRTRNTTYLTRAKTLLRGMRTKNGGTYNNTFYDDMEWLGIASVRAYELTGDTEYLTVAEGLWTRIKTGYSSGLFSWNTSCHPNCKNAISINPAIVLGARLYGLGRISAADRTIIETAYANGKRILVDPATGAVWDGTNLAAGTINRSTYSYNQGLFIGAALELYKLSGNATYMADAKKTADWAITARTVDGMIFDNERGGGDGGLFKGILVRYLALFAREGNLAAADRTRYIRAIKHSANVLNSKGLRRPEILAATNWAVTPGTVTPFSSQLSGVFLQEAAAVIDHPMVYRNTNYEGSWSSLPAGSYTTAQLAARGVANDDITSVTVPPGWTVTLFENDNFTGASLVRTANDTLLGASAWNDRATSVRVTAPASNAVVTVYQNCNAGGYSVSLPPGSYNLAALQTAGVVNNDLSSFVLAAGHNLTLFQEANLTGANALQTTTNSCLTGIGFNDNVSSLRVAPLN